MGEKKRNRGYKGILKSRFSELSKLYDEMCIFACLASQLIALQIPSPPVDA